MSARPDSPVSPLDRPAAVGSLARPASVRPHGVEGRAVVGIAEGIAGPPKQGVGNTLVFAIEGARHRRQFGRLEWHFRRRLDAHPHRRVGHDILRRRGKIVGDVEDAAETALRQMPERAGDIGDMDAIEHLILLDQTLGGAVAQIDEGVAARPVNAGKPQNGDGHADLARRAPARPAPLPAAAASGPRPAGIPPSRRSRRPDGRHRRQRSTDSRSRQGAASACGWFRTMRPEPGRPRHPARSTRRDG